MSLILEALKKLEREKDAPERGFLVMAHVPWAPGGRGRLRLVVGAVVLLLAIGTVAWLVGRGGPKATPQATATSTAAPPPPAAAPGTAAVPPSVAALPPRPVEPTPAPQTSPQRDRPPGPAAPAPEFRLNAISRQDGHPVALLNDRLVREGDSFDGVRIVRIGETEVEIEVGGKRRVIGF